MTGNVDGGEWRMDNERGRDGSGGDGARTERRRVEEEVGRRRRGKERGKEERESRHDNYI